MTVPNERKAAVMNTEKFLLRLMDPKQTPRVPKAIRQEARGLLKHYPTEYYVEEVFDEHTPDYKSIIEL